MKSLNALLDGRSERERWILLGGIFAGIPLLVWLLLWQPLLDARASAEERLTQRQQIYSWMQGAAAQVTAARGRGQSLGTVSGSPQQQITSAARQFGVNISRIEPQSNGRFLVQVAMTDYNSAVRFIDALLMAGMPLDSLSMGRLDVPGRVSLRATLGGAS